MPRKIRKHDPSDRLLPLILDIQAAGDARMCRTPFSPHDAACRKIGGDERCPQIGMFMRLGQMIGVVGRSQAKEELRHLDEIMR
ncbi:hypothetical protein HNP52_002936 [Sphingomonas kyeonggiensis]|uniref:Uncharacterized protein n=1 Tax=Sphingomonas kyeonggiensis TaxID=1268553 RepID=A0A7W7K2K2_9SPHN|nr:hypothetical protein [Sphingomonas kyeonggiensis]MBB4839844.1 hypothetical protein [Sphingomonas kyeonggiensis]